MQSSQCIPRRFMVLSMEGSAARWLVDCINSVPGAQGHGELFHPEWYSESQHAGCSDYLPFVEIGGRFANGRRPGSVIAYLDRFYSRPGTIGFTLSYPQLKQYPEILWYVIRRQVRVIHLVRKDILDDVMAEANGWGAKTTVKPGRVLARIRWLERRRRILNSLLRISRVPMHETTFEDLFAEGDVLARMYEFIGISGDAARRATTQDIDPAPEMVRNHAEASTALRDADYRRAGQ